MQVDDSNTTQPRTAEPQKLVQMLWAFTVSQAVSASAKLGIVDVIADGPKSLEDISKAVGANEAALLRLLRALTSFDLLVEDEVGRFYPTPTGELLRSDHPQSVRPSAMFLGSEFIWRAWEHLEDAVVTGKPAFELVHGVPYFEYLANTPEDASLFNAFTGGASIRHLPPILAAYDFSKFSRIVDVGGGQGAFLQGILEACPHAQSVLFELPGVIATADELRRSTVGSRCEIVSGDMFESVPAGGDAYLLKGVLHDWSDAAAGQILRNCRRAIKDGGKLLVIEAVNAPPSRADFAKLLDLMMLVLLTGRERTEADFRDLFAAADFRLTRVIPTGTFPIIEGVPI